MYLLPTIVLLDEFKHNCIRRMDISRNDFWTTHPHCQWLLWFISLCICLYLEFDVRKDGNWRKSEVWEDRIWVWLVMNKPNKKQNKTKQNKKQEKERKEDKLRVNTVWEMYFQCELSRCEWPNSWHGWSESVDSTKWTKCALKKVAEFCSAQYSYSTHYPSSFIPSLIILSCWHYSSASCLLFHHPHTHSITIHDRHSNPATLLS